MQSLIRCGCFRNSDSNKKNLFHGQVAAQGGWTVYKMTHSKREITYTGWSDIPFH